MLNKQKDVPLSGDASKPRIVFAGFSKKTYKAISQYFEGYPIDEASGLASLRKMVREKPADVIFVDTRNLGNDAVLAAHQLQGREVSTIAVHAGVVGARGSCCKKIEKHGPVFVPIDEVLKGIFPQTLTDRLVT